jgi:NAD(P)-dependent dehydrogenase (short-subunit alcohol dehydrogenase family)
VSDLRGKTIVVTGGSSGIGRAMALAFASHGADVVIGDIRREPREGGEPTATLIESAGGSVLHVDADVSRWEDVDRLARSGLERFGRLDVLVNNAILTGPHHNGILDTSEGDWDAMMAVGLRGVFLCCKRFIAAMVDQEPVAETRGRVINMASQAGFLGSPGSFTYDTLKGGVINMTRQLAVEYAPAGVVVNAIAPGKILTMPLDEPDSPETLEHARLRTPFPRLGQPEDVARLAVFLASDDCTYMTGAIVPLDGGWLAAF